MSIYSRLDAERAARGLTWGRIATLTHISKSAFTKWKQGQEPDLHSLMKLADLFVVSLDQLVGRMPKIHDLTPRTYHLTKQEETLVLAYRKDPGIRRICNVVVATRIADSAAEIISKPRPRH